MYAFCICLMVDNVCMLIYLMVGINSTVVLLVEDLGQFMVCSQLPLSSVTSPVGMETCDSNHYILL